MEEKAKTEIEKLVDWLADFDSYDGPSTSQMRDALTKAYELGFSDGADGASRLQKIEGVKSA